MSINVSIVLYNHSLAEVALLAGTLRESSMVSNIFLIDNSPVYNSEFSMLPVTYIFNNKNLGYGAAHNIAIRKTIDQKLPYHLVVNPDITFDPIILKNIVNFMDNNSDIGLLMPKVYYPNGEIQYLCKLLPTPADLIFRRFLPRKWAQKQIAKFEMRAWGYNRTMDVPYLSGCFMFLRTEAVRQAGMFDERFFMYPEDIDLTRRIHRKYRTVFYPEVSVVHQHAQGSYKNLKLLFIHVWNMIKYFNKWGWVFDKERREVNNETLKQLIN
jgi:GT2 family glycosyltransferase